jgi:hypothetical protein
MSRDYRADDIDGFGALEQPDGSYIDDIGDIFWYNEAGEYHREDGPAVIYNDGHVDWLLHSHPHTFESWCIELNKTDEAKMLLRLQYG